MVVHPCSKRGVHATFTPVVHLRRLLHFVRDAGRLSADVVSVLAPSMAMAAASIGTAGTKPAIVAVPV